MVKLINIHENMWMYLFSIYFKMGFYVIKQDLLNILFQIYTYTSTVFIKK